MKRLLLIAYSFPPLLEGVRRPVSFARYLPEFGWRVDALTVKPVRSWAYDPAPLAELEQAGTSIYRTGSRDPYRAAWLLGRLRDNSHSHPKSETQPPNIDAPIDARRASPRSLRFMAWMRRHWFCPDDRAGWVGPAARMAMESINRAAANEKYDAILTTSFPHSAHLVGLRIKRAHPEIRWVADFRDGWTQNPSFFPDLSPRLQARSRAMELSVAREADAVVAVTEPIAAHFRQLLSNKRASHAVHATHATDATGAGDNVRVITNGFDPRDIASAEPIRHDGFVIAYTGTLFGARDARPLFRAAARAIELDERMRGDLRLVFVGAFDASLREHAREYGLDGRLILTGALPYREALGVQKGADVLAALVARETNAEAIATQKIFEYLATGRPILLLTPPSACRDIVEAAGGAAIVDPDDTDAAAQALIRMRAEAERGEWRGASPHALVAYDRRALAGLMAAVLDGAAQGASIPRP